MNLIRKVLDNTQQVLEHRLWARLFLMIAFFSGIAIFATNFPSAFKSGDMISSVQFNDMFNELDDRVKGLEESIGNVKGGMVAAFEGECPGDVYGGQWVRYAKAEGRVLVGTFPEGNPYRDVGGTNDVDVKPLHLDGNNGGRWLSEVPAHEHTTPQINDLNTSWANLYNVYREDGSGPNQIKPVARSTGTTKPFNGGGIYDHGHTYDIPAMTTNSTSYYDVNGTPTSAVDAVNVAMPYVQLTYCKFVPTAP